MDFSFPAAKFRRLEKTLSQNVMIAIPADLLPVAGHSGIGTLCNFTIGKPQAMRGWTTGR